MDSISNRIFGLGIVTGLIIGIVCGALGSALINGRQVQPIDVNRGKTEIVVTYKNDVAVDSVVVYKVR